ncbi:MAG: tyrosine-type recombinase/integrase [Herpetosiphonaceae bacterium]|nr:tyrosine-type recombinase/integrase [Herpetosiphonaceae bacterium]
MWDGDQDEGDATIVQGSIGTALDLAVAAWLDAKGGRSGSAKTLRAYHDTLQRFRQWLHTHHADLDSPPQALGLLAQRWAGLDQPAPATYNQRLAILSSFYRYAIRHGLLTTTNPIDQVERRTVDSYGGAVPLDRDRLRVLLQAIDRTTLAGQRDYALLVVALQTGRRLGELAGMRLGDLQVRGSTITVTWQRTKGGKTMRDRLVSTTTTAVTAWLQAMQAAVPGPFSGRSPVWCSLAINNRTLGHPLTTRAISDICRLRLGTGKVHTLRHTFARAMEETGAKVSEIQARLGHTSLAVTGRYLQALRGDDNQHAAAVLRLLGVEEVAGEE